MKLLMIRHAAAEDKAPAGEGDLARRLTEQGARKARRAFRALAKACPAPDLILSSEATRARETADILSSCFGAGEIVVTDLLNPGSHHGKLLKLLKEYGEDKPCLAVVGHEPDLSRILADLVGNGTLRVAVKKASCAEVEINKLGKGELQMLIPAGFLEDVTA